jgi:hypothetical protein
MIAAVRAIRTLSFVPTFGKLVLTEQPKMYRRSLVEIYPPPGMNLQVPEWTPE